MTALFIGKIMKIALASDVHLEFEQLSVQDQPDADVLILAGDICVAAGFKPPITRTAEKYLEFFKACSEKYRDVIYIMGNHEHYNGNFTTTVKILKDNLSEFPNIKILDKEFVVIDGVTFVCGTLWTDFNNRDPVTMVAIRAMMNDFRAIKNTIKGQDRVFNPEDALRDHDIMKDVIRGTVAHSNKVVVVGHHAPSFKSVHPRYILDREMNGGYCSSLEDMMIDNPNIKLWVHGHTHTGHDYKIGDTRVVCNPRGYVMYERKSQKEEPYYFKEIEL